jgi:ABC-type transport system involved in multi-copper enzyme maturation permease subunit
MLWYKSWLDTRWRFLIGLVLLMCSAAGTVLEYPRVAALLPLVHPAPATGLVARRIQEIVDLSRDYRGYIWAQAFRQNLPQMATLFAVLLGVESLWSRSSRSATHFMLSLPVSRRHLLGVRAATGLGELFLLTTLPPLVVPLLSPSIGASYDVGAALAHGLCIFAACSVFFGLALLLSTVFVDVWRPLLIACAFAVALSLAGAVAGDLSRYSIFHLMTGELYFRTGRLPWLGLLTSVAASAALVYAAGASLSRRDF